MDSTEINPVGSAETRLYDSMVIVPAGQRAAHSPQRMHRDSSFSTSYALLGLSAFRAHGTQSPPTRKLPFSIAVVIPANQKWGLPPYRQALPYHPRIALDPVKTEYQCCIHRMCQSLPSRILRRAHLLGLHLLLLGQGFPYPTGTRVLRFSSLNRLYRTFLGWVHRTFLYPLQPAEITNAARVAPTLT